MNLLLRFQLSQLLVHFIKQDGGSAGHFRGLFETALAPGEMLVGVDVPMARPGDFNAFDELARRSQGNPLFLLEMVRSLLELGPGSHPDALGTLPARGGTSPSIAANARATLAEVLDDRP